MSTTKELLHTFGMRTLWLCRGLGSALLRWKDGLRRVLLHSGIGNHFIVDKTQTMGRGVIVHYIQMLFSFETLQKLVRAHVLNRPL